MFWGHREVIPHLKTVARLRTMPLLRAEHEALLAGYSSLVEDGAAETAEGRNGRGEEWQGRIYMKVRI
jgi:hypothetical protein